MKRLSDPVLLLTHVWPPCPAPCLVSAVCATLEEVGLAAIFGPGLEPASSHVQSICDAKAIPHVQTHPRDVSARKQFSINLHPQPAMLRRVSRDAATRRRHGGPWTSISAELCVCVCSVACKL